LNKSKQQFEVFVGFPMSTIYTFVLLCTMQNNVEEEEEEKETKKKRREEEE
jgi:hypothetical protein